MPASSKNQCPYCGQEKTSWSLKCAECEHTRKRVVEAVDRRDDDVAFLQRYDGWSLARIGADRKVSRERARQLKENAYRRLATIGIIA